MERFMTVGLALLAGMAGSGCLKADLEKVVPDEWYLAPGDTSASVRFLTRIVGSTLASVRISPLLLGPMPKT